MKKIYLLPLFFSSFGFCDLSVRPEVYTSPIPSLPITMPYILLSVTNGGTTTIPDGQVGGVVLKSTGALLVFTVKMPANPVDGQIITVAANRAITSLIVTPNVGQSVTNGTTSFILGQRAQSWIYVLSDTNWYPN